MPVEVVVVVTTVGVGVSLFVDHNAAVAAAPVAAPAAATIASVTLDMVVMAGLGLFFGVVWRFSQAQGRGWSP